MSSSPRSGARSSAPSSPGLPSSSSPRDLADSEAEEEDGEELIGDNMMEDYRAIPELDRYDADGIDDEEVEEMDQATRIRAEREMRRRDMEAARRAGRTPAALQFGMGVEEEENDGDRPRRRRLIAEAAAGETGQVSAFDEDQGYANLDDYKGPVREYLLLDSTKREVRRRFRLFLTEFRSPSGGYEYMTAINTMCAENKQSLDIGYTHLSNNSPMLAVWLADQPETMLQLLSQEAMEIARTLFPGYDHMHAQVIVRIKDLPILDSIRDLRQLHLNGLIKVAGVAVRRTQVYPQLMVVKYNCLSCNDVVGPYFQTSTRREEVKPKTCPSCQRSGPFQVNMRETLYQNYQKITLQESPGSVPAGRVPRQKDVIVLHDLIDICSPGEEIEVTGVYKHAFDQDLNRQNGFPVFSTVILANHITKRDESSSSYLTSDDDIKDIIKLSKQPNVAKLIINSIAPSIYGHEHIKTCIAMSLFGGCAKTFDNNHRLRGDINVLLLGDPGTAKSQFLKYTEKIAQRAVYTTGKGASAVGLTASVHRDPITKEFALEGGALVLADQGTCLIDEFDKMSDKDRTSIHEAMEQQTISISKAGIVCSLKARCGVIAAANPVSGRYINTLSFQEQVDLTEPILSRFDCLCVVRDIVDRTSDRRLASFVVDSHMNSHPTDPSLMDSVMETQESKAEQRRALEAKEQIPQDLLRKYIAYARKTCQPRLQTIDGDKLVKLYSDLRKEAETSGGIKITLRQLESMVRMAEAHAKMHLREYVSEEDVDVAIRTMLESFISTQKLSVKTAMERQFQKYITYAKDKFELLLDALNEERKGGLLLRQLSLRLDAAGARRTPLEIRADNFMQRANALGVSDVASFYKSKLFAENGYTYDSARRIIVCNFNN